MEDFPTEALLPKQATGIHRVLAQHPEYDGRNVVVAVFDTGVDPACAHLQQTTDGRRKVIDCIDSTGSGDVDTSKVVELGEDRTVTGLTGRTLKIPEDWQVANNQIRLGYKRLWELFPDPLINRLKKERSKPWREANLQCLSAARAELAKFDSEHSKLTSKEDKVQRDELAARVAALEAAEKNWQDVGPVADCIVFHNGEEWLAAVDTSLCGDLSGVPAMRPYRVAYEHSRFSDADCLTYSFNIENDGNLLSIVTTSGSHGTHVAGIVAAYHPDDPERNGVAPGAQIVSVKIGDSRLSAMETGPGLIRGLVAAKKAGCDLVNLSFGEATTLPDIGRIVDVAQEYVREQGIIYVASAGNNGPALSTVGCPGGTTTALMGIGAYVTPEMMKAAYSLPSTRSDVQYTWSSRGPATDGDLGVSISAPGGAITDVPTWTLKAGQLMNGTSMSSPNACGGLAVMLSALKAENIPYTPHSVRRAVENTALDICRKSKLDAGHGVIQVDRAIEHHRAHTSFLDSIAYDVKTRVNGKSGRGIYLREPDQFVSGLTRASVIVSPFTKDEDDNNEKIALETKLSLVSNKDWCHVPSSLMLMHDPRHFVVEVNTKDLAPGLHFAEVQAFVMGDQERGPLFRVPVTVCKPEPLPEDEPVLEWRDMPYSAGHLERKFVHVPDGASWCEVEVQTGRQDAPRSFLLHLVQLQEQEAFSSNEFKKMVTMDSNARETFTIPLIGGRGVEICLAQWWSSSMSGIVSLKVRFNGVVASPVHLIGAGPTSVARVDVAAPVAPVKLEPSAKLTHWRQFVRPSPGTIKPLDGELNLLPKGRRTHALDLTYNFSLKAKTEVRPMLPSLSDVLYESKYEAQMWMLFDSRGKLMKIGDAFPESYAVTLDKGDYEIRYQIRHDSAKELEEIQDTQLALEFSLKDPITLGISSMPPACSSGKLSSMSLPKAGQGVFYVTAPPHKSFPSTIRSGDVAVGSIQLLPGDKNKHGVVPVTVHYTTSAPSKPQHSVSPAEDAEDKGAAAILRDAQISALTKLDDGERLRAIDNLLTDHPSHLPLLVARMNHTKKVKDYEELNTAALTVVSVAKEDEIAEFFGRQADKDDPAMARLHTKMEERKTHLIAALSNLISVQACLLENGQGDHSTEDLLSAALGRIESLRPWTNPETHSDCALDVVRIYMHAERFGTALNVLQKYMASDDKHVTQEAFKLRDQLFEVLGWNHLVDDNERIVTFPPSKPLF